MKIEVPGQGPVSALLDTPSGAAALLVLAHGAGAGMRHPAMEALAKALNERSIATLRYQFPYMDRGSKRPDSPDTAVATVAAAVEAAARLGPKLPLFAGGKSFGGRMTTTAAARGKISAVRGIVCFGFPLHPAKKPSTARAEHLAEVRIPSLLINGTRDDLADLKLLKKVVKDQRAYLALHLIEGADHGFHVLKSSGRTDLQVLAEVADVSSAFLRR